MNANSIILASIAVTVVLILNYIYLYVTEKKSYILMWLAAWMLLLIVYISRYFVSDLSKAYVLSAINGLSNFGCYWFVLYGTSLFFQSRIPMIIKFVLSAAFVFSVIGVIVDPYGYWHVIPIIAGFGSAFICMGVSICRLSSIKASYKWIIGFSFIFWGLGIISYPLFKIYHILPISLGYLLVGSVGLIAAISLQAAYFQKLRNQLSEHEQNLYYNGMHDKLTGLYNRTFFESEMSRIDTEAQLPISIVIGDLSGLKLINDTFGHAKGDELLVDAASALKQSCRKQDVIARWGGDEFVILLPNTDFQTAQIIAFRITENFRNYSPKTIPLCISLGVATKENIFQKIQDIFQSADEGMYKNKLLESKDARKNIIAFLEKALWEKDYQTEEHVTRLKALVNRFAHHISLSEKVIEELSLVAALHDIGKIAVPIDILQKMSPLSKEEWEIIKRHSETGYRIAQSSRELVQIADAILSHHEWWNGEGYPLGLKGSDIPLYARIIAIADSFDVMTHERPYKKMMSENEALKEIIQCAGKQFDPYLVELFARMINETSVCDSFEYDLNF